MHRERDGIRNEVQYDLYRQGRKKKRCVTTPCDEMFRSFDGAVGGDEVGDDEMS